MFNRFKQQDSEQQRADQLDLMQQAVDDVEGDEFLSANNLGLGNYTDDEMWQQIESFKTGLYGEAGFADLINEMAIEKTKREMAREKWRQLSDEDRAQETRREWIIAKKEELWDDLGDIDREVGDREDRRALELERKAEAIEEHLGAIPDWIPPHWRMLLARHETSRSREARLIDNLFDRVDEVQGDVNVDNILGGSS